MKSRTSLTLPIPEYGKRSGAVSISHTFGRCKKSRNKRLPRALAFVFPAIILGIHFIFSAVQSKNGGQHVQCYFFIGNIFQLSALHAHAVFVFFRFGGYFYAFIFRKNTASDRMYFRVKFPEIADYVPKICGTCFLMHVNSFYHLFTT